MSSIGPDLPPHLLAKRKRRAEEENAAPAVSKKDVRSSPGASEKRRRVAGPAPPPAPLDERPPHSPRDDDSSSSDDEFGPALPTGDVSIDYREDKLPPPEISQPHASGKKPQRDEWMMMPPQQDDLAARMDPTKIRARKFNTGKGAQGGDASGGSSLWTETAEQKQKRLQDEVLGIKQPESTVGQNHSSKSRRREEEKARKIKENLDKSRGESLFVRHQETNTVEEDDPSKRAFDREKDMGTGLKLGNAQRKELMNRAADFGSKFSGGGYL